MRDVGFIALIFNELQECKNYAPILFCNARQIKLLQIGDVRIKTPEFYVF